MTERLVKDNNQDISCQVFFAFFMLNFDISLIISPDSV
jgi:hypothetical protein